MAVNQHRVGQRPEMLGRLELRRVRRQKQQVNVLRHAQAHAGMSPRPIEHEDNLLAGASADLAGKLGQLHFEDGNADSGGQMKDGAPRGGMHEADQVALGEAMAHQGNRTLANRCPDSPQEQLEADPVFVDSPEFDLSLRGPPSPRLLGGA